MQNQPIRNNRIQEYINLLASSSQFLAGKLLYKQQMLLQGFLGYIASKFNTNSALQNEMKGTQGWINVSVGMKSEDDSAKGTIIFKDGTVKLLNYIPNEVDCTLIFSTPKDLIEQMDASPDEAYRMILTGRVRTEGNIMLIGLFNYYVNLIVGRDQQKSVDKQISEHKKANKIAGKEVANTSICRNEQSSRKITRLRSTLIDPGVMFLEDPFLSNYGLEDFPRIQRFRSEYFNRKKEAVVCHEYGKLITDFHLEYGYDVDNKGKTWDPNLRKAESLKYILERRKPIIREDDLLAGTYTTDPVSGCIGHPFAVGCYSWGELRSFANRELMPYEISEETIQILHKHVFPFWARRNIHELWRSNTGNGLPIQIHDRFFSIFYWKTVSMSEITPGHEKILKHGTKGMIKIIRDELNNDYKADEEKKNTLKAMIICLEAINIYAKNLAQQAAKDAQIEKNPKRKMELEQIKKILVKVPENPSTTVDEAVQAMIIVHLCLTMENSDDGPMLGRLDQILQPYFISDMNKLSTPEEKEIYVKHTIDLLGSLFYRVASHQILIPDIGNWQNSGSAPNTTITVGGVDRDGEDAVNDMTYIILKVTELAGLNDPNMHARYNPGKNSLNYLKRVCDVNYITGATPCIHGDDAMFAALTNHGWPIEDVRNWVANGCVEPSIPGKHSSATSSLEINLVAPLEMALNNGKHPLTKWEIGPGTGSINGGDFITFDQFWNAFEKQCKFLLELSVVGNNQLGEIYQKHQPAPLLSVLIDDCIEKGRGLTRGGGHYNSTGVSVIGLADVVDSLMVTKKLVFEEKVVTFKDLKEAIDSNFYNNPKLHALVKTRVPRFGSGNNEAIEMANKVTGMVHDYYINQRNYRGGIYTTGWWSMANHAVYGRVTGALPTGRLAGEPFTPGLTPHPSASVNLLDNLRDVARLDPRNLDNNIAFNVKIVPGASDTHEKIVDTLTHYAKTYFEMGGMQTQFNVVTTDILKDALANPEYYQDLMVRISGYVAYFTKLQRDLQLEVIRRAEYRI